jgi:hypothetical protein
MMEEDLETLEFEEPKTKSKEYKCTNCNSNGYCRKHNVSKGSVTCDVNRGLREPKKKNEPSDQAKGMSMMGYLMQKMGK